MMRIKPVRLLFVLISLLLIGSAVVMRAQAAGPSLLLSPTTTSSAVNQNVTFTLSIDTNNVQVFGADTIITYPSSLIDIVSVTKGDFFSDFSYSASNGSLEIHGYFASLFDFKAGTGTVATIVAKPKQTGSTSTLAIVCNSSSQTSQIINSQGANILNCSNVNQSVITVASPSNTPQPSSTTAPGQPSHTPTRTPTQAPGGNQTPNCNSLSVNPASGYKPLTVNLSCAGTDTDNDITAAEFDFGNGAKLIVNQNVGLFGSIATSYTYATVGTYTATCRVKDNNQAWSAIPDNCKKTITTTARTTSSTSATVPTRTPTQRPGTTPLPTPTVGFGSRIALAPYATPTSFALPAPERETPTPKKFGLFGNGISMALIGGILLFIILILLLLRYLGKKSEQDNLPPPPIVQ